jgi:hypothetical protein
MDHPDRRRTRSRWPSQALNLQLRAVAARHRLERLVLADSLGHLWAASHIDRESGRLAAALPRLATRRRRPGEGATGVRTLRVRAARLYLGARGACGEQGLDEALPGVRRILAQLP